MASPGRGPGREWILDSGVWGQVCSRKQVHRQGCQAGFGFFFFLGPGILGLAGAVGEWGGGSICGLCGKQRHQIGKGRRC